jgi:hypothetical protein
MSCEIQPKQDLNLETAVDTSIPVFDAAKTERYHKLTDYFMSKIFAENADKNGWTVKDLLKPENAKRMVAGLKASFENMLIDTALKNPGYFDLSAEVVKDVAETLIPNVDQFLGHYFKFNPIATIEDLAETTEDPDNKSSSSENEDQGSVREEEEDDDLKPSKEYGETQENPIKLASKETKLLFRLTPKMQLVNGQPQLVFDSHGLPMPTDFGPTFNLLLNKMAGTKDYHEFISMLTSIDTLRVIPEAQHLSKLLKVSKPGQELTPNEFNLFTKFYQSFSKPKIPVQSLLMQANGNIILINEIVGNITAIRQQFAANFQSGEVHPLWQPLLLRMNWKAGK